MAIGLTVGVLAILLTLGNVQSFGLFQLGGGLAGGFTNAAGLGGGISGSRSGYGSASSSLKGSASGVAGVQGNGGADGGVAGGIAGGFGAGGYGSKDFVAGGKGVSGVSGEGHGAIADSGEIGGSLFGFGDIIHTGIDILTGNLHGGHDGRAGVNGEGGFKIKGSVEGSASGNHDVVGGISERKDSLDSTQGGVVKGTGVSTRSGSYTGGGYTSHSHFVDYVNGRHDSERDFDGSKDGMNKGTEGSTGSGIHLRGGYGSYGRSGERHLVGDNYGGKHGHDGSEGGYNDRKVGVTKGTDSSTESGSYSGGGYSSHGHFEEHVGGSRFGEKDSIGDNHDNTDGHDSTNGGVYKGTGDSTGREYEGYGSHVDKSDGKDGLDSSKGVFSKGVVGSTGSSSVSGSFGGYGSTNTKGGIGFGDLIQEGVDIIAGLAGLRTSNSGLEGAGVLNDKSKESVANGIEGKSAGLAGKVGSSYQSASSISSTQSGGHFIGNHGDRKDFIDDKSGGKDGAKKGTDGSIGRDYDDYDSHGDFRGHVGGTHVGGRDKNGYDGTKGVNKENFDSTESGSRSGGGYSSHGYFEEHVGGSRYSEKDSIGDNRGRNNGHDGTKDGVKKGTDGSIGRDYDDYDSHGDFRGHVGKTHVGGRDKNGDDGTKGVNKENFDSTESGSRSGGGYSSYGHFEGHVGGSRYGGKDSIGDNRGGKDGYDGTKDGAKKGTDGSIGRDYDDYDSHGDFRGHVGETHVGGRDKDGHDVKKGVDKENFDSTGSGSHSGGSYSSYGHFEGHVGGSRYGGKDSISDNRGGKDGYDGTKDGAKKGTDGSIGRDYDNYDSHGDFRGHVGGTHVGGRDKNGYDGTKGVNKENFDSTGSGSYSGGGYSSHGHFEEHVGGIRNGEKDSIGDNHDNTDGHDGTNGGVNKGTGDSTRREYEGYGSHVDKSEGKDGLDSSKGVFSKGVVGSTGSSSVSGSFGGYGSTNTKGGIGFGDLIQEGVNVFAGLAGLRTSNSGSEGAGVLSDKSKESVANGIEGKSAGLAGKVGSSYQSASSISSTQSGGHSIGNHGDRKDFIDDKSVGKDGLDGSKGVFSKGVVGSSGSSSISGSFIGQGSTDTKGGIGFGDLIQDGVNVFAGLAGLRTSNSGLERAGVLSDQSKDSGKVGSSYQSVSSTSSSQSGGGIGKLGGSLFGGGSSGAGLQGGFAFGII